MNSILTALVLTAATVLPVSAGIHDFNPANAAPQRSSQRAQVGQGQCFSTEDKSKVCYVKTSPSDFSIAILDVDYPAGPEVAHIDCSTGRWGAYGDISKATLELYLSDFCTTYG